MDGTRTVSVLLVEVKLYGGRKQSFEFREESWLDDWDFGARCRYDMTFGMQKLDTRILPEPRGPDFFCVPLSGPASHLPGSYDMRTMTGWSRTLMETDVVGDHCEELSFRQRQPLLALIDHVLEEHL